MSAKYLEDLESNAIHAVHALEGERYTEFSWGLMELVRQAKHYQRIAESLLAAQTSLPLKQNTAEFNRANNDRDWFRYEKAEEACPTSRKSIQNSSGE